MSAVGRDAQAGASDAGGGGGAPSKAASGRHYWLILAGLLVLLAGLWWGLGRVRRDEVLDLAIKNRLGAVTEFRIPRVYFAAQDVPDGREQQFIYLTVYLPGLLPRDAEEKAGYQTSIIDGGGLELPSDNEVLITLEASIEAGVKRVFHGRIGEPNVRFDGIRADGFAVYTITKKNYSGNYLPDPNQGEYLKPVGRNGAFIECGSLDRPASYSNCEVHTQFSDKLEIHFFLNRSRLAEWASVEAKVKKLVASVVVE